MHRKWNFSVARLAPAFITLSLRFKNTKARPSVPLGSRILTSRDDIFKHNMWDHVQWTEQDEENARQKAEENSSVQLPLTDQGKFDTDACQYWDKFYEVHQDKFFKDRRWLFLEFPELLPSWLKDQATNSSSDHQHPGKPLGSNMDAEMGLHQDKDPTQTHRNIDHFHFQEAPQEQKEVSIQTSSYPGCQASFRILEVGCGVGNSVFPIVNDIKKTNSFLYCCDFSPRAIQLVKAHPDYDDSVCHAFVHDICKEAPSFPFPPQSLDIILAVFVLSSIHPDRMRGAVKRLSAHLKPGGIFLFRDYGRYDLSQLRFKKEEVRDLFSNAGLEEIQNLEDRRLQVNRGKKVVMRRVWMQSKFRKPHPS
ncbi:tRNA N(3)-cytidine methyltransferase METTL8, mitochondrial isoform 2-T2 [Xenentodon cancila]